MKYGMQHKINRDLITCETRSPIETLCAFAGHLVAHMPNATAAEFERTMWYMVELPKDKPIRPYKPTRKHQHITVSVTKQGLGILTTPVSMYSATQAGYVRFVEV